VSIRREDLEKLLAERTDQILRARDMSHGFLLRELVPRENGYNKEKIYKGWMKDYFKIDESKCIAISLFEINRIPVAVLTYETQFEGIFFRKVLYLDEKGRVDYEIAGRFYPLKKVIDYS